MTERQPLIEQDELEKGRPRPDYRRSPDNGLVDVNSDDSGEFFVCFLTFYENVVSLSTIRKLFRLGELMARSSVQYPHCH